jgi:hypothetical protein
MLRTNLNLNPDRARSYQADFQELQAKAETILAKLGFRAPFNDGEWTDQRAVERMNRRPISPTIGAFLNAFNKVRASFLSAFSLRETVVESVHAVLSVLPDLDEQVAEYRDERPGEVEQQKLWSDWINEPTPHSAERNERVDATLRRCLAANAEMRAAYSELLQLLIEERPAVVDALYAKGGGPKVEFPMRAEDEQLDMDQAAILRGDFKQLRHVKGPARRKRMKTDRAKAAARARSDAARARSLIAARGPS